MIPHKEIDNLRNKLIAIIYNAVATKNGCIGMYYKNLGDVHTVNQTEEEYDTTPIAIITHSDKNFALGGVEAVTVYDIYIRDNKLICFVSNETGDFFEEPIDLVAIDSLNNIINWLYEHNFAKQENEISDNMLDKILEDENLCESILDTMVEQHNTDDTSPGRQMAQIIRAYKNNDCRGMILGFCGWELPSLIAKATGADEYNLFIGGSLFSKMEKHIKTTYPLWTPSDNEGIHQLIKEEFDRIKNIVCEEYDFNDDQYKEIFNGKSPFTDVFPELQRHILHNIQTSHTRGNESWQKLIDSLTLLYEMSSPAGMYREIASFYSFDEYANYFDN